MVPDTFLTFCLRHGCGLMPSDGLTLQEIDGYGTTDSATTEYFYDHANGLTKVIDPEGNSTNYVLNADGQSVSVTLDLSTGLSSEAFSYNLANQLVQTVDGDGRTDTYVNNADGLVMSESAGGSYSFTYDQADDMLTATDTQGTDTFSYSFSYNADGQVLTVSEPFGASLSFGYDLAGNQTSISDSFGGVESIGYDADGDMTSLTYSGGGNSIPLGFTDNQANQMTQEQESLGVGLISTLIAQVSVSYNADGNATKITDTGNSGGTLDSFSYSYNAAGAVTGESDYSGLSMSYSYNHVGELVDDSTYTYGVNEAGDPSAAGDSVSSGNELSTFVDPVSGNTLSMTYDAAGNELTKTNTYTSITWTYTYNNFNQVASAVETSGTLTLQSATYEYDPFGDLLKESVTPYVSGVAGTPVVTEYAVDGWSPASQGVIGNSNFVTWAVMNGSGAIESRNFFGNGPNQILARIDNASNGASDASGIYFVLTDRLGSVRDVLNSTTNAAPVDEITYKAWGIMSQTAASYLGLFGYAGYEQDQAATNIDLVNGRDYDPQLERWMEMDPLGIAAGDPNYYRYAGDNPTNATDPSGLWFDVGFSFPTPIPFVVWTAGVRFDPLAPLPLHPFVGVGLGVPNARIVQGPAGPPVQGLNWQALMIARRPQVAGPMGPPLWWPAQLPWPRFLGLGAGAQQ